MTCANCPKPVVGGKSHSPYSVLCESCCNEWQERHAREVAQRIQRRIDSTKEDLLA
jgi:hypothetical protein